MHPDQPRVEQQPDPRIARLRKHVRGESDLGRNPEDIYDDCRKDLILVRDVAADLEEAARQFHVGWDDLRHQSSTGDDSDKRYRYVLETLDQLRAVAGRSAEVTQALQRIAGRAKLD